jgi:MYXO-CTERM domain-containing protein
VTDAGKKDSSVVVTEANGFIGLATGGGGCACRMGPSRRDLGALAFGAVLVVGTAWRRRKKRDLVGARKAGGAL